MIETLRCLIFINTVLSTEFPSLSPYSGQSTEIKIEQEHPKIITSDKEATYDSKKLYNLAKYERNCFIEVSKPAFDGELRPKDETLGMLNKHIDLKHVVALFGQDLCNIPYSGPSLLLTISERAGIFEKIGDKDFHFFRRFNLKILKNLGIRGEEYLPHSCSAFGFQRLMQAMFRNIVLGALLREQIEKAKMLDIMVEIPKQLKILASKIENEIRTESLVLENILIDHLTCEFFRMIQEKANFLDDELVKIIDVSGAENHCSKVLIMNFMLYFSFIRSILEILTSKDSVDWTYNSIEKTLTNIKWRGDTKTGIFGRSGDNLTANHITATQNITRRLEDSLNQIMGYEKKQPPTAESFESIFLKFKLLSRKVLIKCGKEGLADIFNQLESNISHMKGCLCSFGDQQAITVFKTQDLPTIENPASGFSRAEPNPSNLFDEESSEAYDDPFLKETLVGARDFEESSSDDGYFYSCRSSETLRKEVENPCYRARLEKTLLKSKLQSAPESSSFPLFMALVLILIAISVLGAVCCILKHLRKN